MMAQHGATPRFELRAGRLVAQRVRMGFAFRTFIRRAIHAGVYTSFVHSGSL
ncbi:hypothetical protein [Paraburkholderia sp.]|uniref:hypothetical protein n=1 Tax=Paraburkholderia sp. TaxID=1926495 RepID=UPI00286F326D|nr:hypothetical protein [Paraburkholderia sp.]